MAIGREGRAWIFIQLFIYILCLLDVKILQRTNSLSKPIGKLNVNSANVGSFRKDRPNAMTLGEK